MYKMFTLTKIVPHLPPLSPALARAKGQGSYSLNSGKYGNSTLIITSLILLLFAICFPGGAFAGGLHYQVSTSTRFYADDTGNLAGVRMNWVYDAEVSAFILEGRETSEAGLQQLAEDMLLDLHELGYFTQFRLNGTPLPVAKVSDYSIQLTSDNSLQLGIQLPLTAGIDVSGKTMSLTLADPDGTANMVYTGVDRIVLADTLAAKCSSPDLQVEPLEVNGHELTIQTVSVVCQ